jgi:hypothetical protein
VVDRLAKMPIVGGAILAFGSELLSLWGLFSFWPVLTLWTLTAAGCCFVVWEDFREGVASLSPVLREWRLEERVLLGLILALTTCALVSGLFSPPNSWDSMVVHLPRQVRWIQQGSLEHFPAYVPQQLSRGPFAEILQADLQLITGTDLTTQIVSWAALLLCLLYVGLMAGELLGVSRRGRLFSLLMALCVPAGFLEASTTKNDLVVAAWSLAVVWLVLHARKASRLSRSDALLIGLSLGLAGLTKSTAYLLMAPFVPVIGWTLFKSRDRFVCGTLILSAFLSLNLAHWARNLDTFGAPLGPVSMTKTHVNTSMSLPRFLSRVTREASLEVATPVDSVNRGIEESIRALHEWIRIDVLDPATTYPNRRFQVLFLPYNEYQADAPLSFLLLALLPICGLIFRRRLSRFWRLLAILPWTMFLSLCLVANWEPVLNPRLHVLLFFISAPTTAGLIEVSLERPDSLGSFAPRTKASVFLIGAGLFMAQILPSFVSSPRSVMGSVFRPRAELLFVQGEHLRPIYEQTAALVRSFRPEVVGIDSKGDWSWEYPLMRLVRRDLYEPAFVSVNPSLVRDRKYRVPDVVVVFRPVETYTDHQSGRTYNAIGHFGFLTVLR